MPAGTSNQSISKSTFICSLDLVGRLARRRQVLLLAHRGAVVGTQAPVAGLQPHVRAFLFAARALRGVPGQLVCNRSVSLFTGNVCRGAKS